MRHFRSPVLVAAAAALIAACGESGPPVPVPTSVSLSSTAITINALGATQQLTATVKDQNGQTMTGQTVTWSAIDPGIATVNTTGLVTAVSNGQTQVTAASGSHSASATVTVTQAVAQLAKTAGDAQTGTVGTQVAAALEVEARDSQGNMVPGSVANGSIAFAVTQGNGSVAQASVPIGANGRAATQFTLGTVAGTAHRVTATLAGGSASVQFTATATAGPADSLVKASGDNQTAPASTVLPESLVVRVADQYGNPVSGHQITFSASGDGSVSPALVATGANGHAATRWTLGSALGGQTADAQAQSAITGSPATFSATASNLFITAVAPDTMAEAASATITGTGFDATPANNTVLIDGTAAAVTAASATSLTVTVPSFDCQPVRAVNVQVSVGGGSSNTVAHPLKPANLVSLVAGEQQIISDPAQFCLQFAASAAGGDAYLIGVGAAAEAPASTMPFTLASVAGAAPAPPFAARPLAVRSGALRTSFATQTEEPLLDQSRAEIRLRDWERRVLPTLGRPLPDRRPEAARVPAGGQQTLAIGDTVHFRVPDADASNPCASYKSITTVVRAIGTAGIWYTDINNPTADSLTIAQIQGYSDTFDVHIYARDTLYFGLPSDIDGNGRIEIVLSIEVNKFAGGVAGFVFGGDLYSGAACASSDSGEIFYGHVPDPTNVAGTGARTKAAVLYQMPSLIAHEFTHNIQQSRRLIILGGSAFMASWEAEGQAMLAQEIVGHNVLGNTTGWNYTSTTAVQGQGDRWYGQAFDQLSRYFGSLPGGGKAANAPELCTLFWTSSVSVPCYGDYFYGASWAFQRYVADRFGPSYPGGEVQLNRDIISEFPNLKGKANWEAVLGMSLDTVQARWAGMLYADDRVNGLPASLQMSSWNLFQIFGSYPSDNYRLVPLDRTFSAFSDSRSVRGGSTAYTRLSSAGARSALAVKVRDAGGAILDTTMLPRLWILRLQ
jgi:hypothetical protein